MAVTTAASLPRLSLPPPATRSTVTSSRFPLNLASVPSCRRLSLRLHRSLVVPPNATSSPSVPSSSSEPGSGIGDALGGVSIFSAATGEPVLIRDLWDQNELPFPLDYLYADPERKAYDLLGLYFGLGRTFFNPASVKVFSRFDSLKEATKNYTIDATPDDRPSVLQQGGMFVFKGKDLLYARKDEGTGDHAPLDDVLNICCKVPVA